MARSLWKGAISFGLVHIPVEMHTAVQSHDLDLTMLDKRDFSPIGFKRYNKSTGKEVSWTTSSRATSTRTASTWCCRTRICARPT